MLGVLLAGPHQLDRLRDFLGDHDRLADEFLDGAAPAEAAAEHGAMNDDLVVRYAGGKRRRHERGRRILGRHPDFDAVRLDVRRAGLRLHGGVGEKGHGVVGSEAPRRARERSAEIAVGAADFGVRRGEAAAHLLRRCRRSTPGRCRGRPS